MDSKLAVLSTTNHLYNTSLYGSLTHESLVPLTPLHQPYCYPLELLSCKVYCLLLTPMLLLLHKRPASPSLLGSCCSPFSLEEFIQRH